MKRDNRAMFCGFARRSAGKPPLRKDMGAVRSNTPFSFRIGSLAMTPLRQRMSEDMEIRNLSPNTQLSYLQQVSSFAKYFHCSPETLGPAEIRDYQV